MISNIGNRGNLLFISFLIFVMLVSSVNSLVTYTTTLVIAPQQTISILKPDSASLLMAITAEKDADSDVSSWDILNLLIDDDTTTGMEIIYNYAGNNKDICHAYTLNSESSDYSKVEIRVYFSTLEVIPYDWRVYVYQFDRNNIDKDYYVDGSSSGTGWTSIDITAIIHQLDGQGFMKVRLISSMSNRNRGKIATVSEMEWILTS
ncbi:hypothetical protein E2P61_06555 [Candidatus Bathyarchaeota archaeon]|nr:hypothetical protein E2P61_06555 [Candidatus Bathyarchaeota archaeon]